MSIGIKTTGANHVALRCTDLARARRFYSETLGVPVIAETPDLFLIQAGGTAIGLRAPTPDTAPGDTFQDSRVGLDHIALGCESDAELSGSRRRCLPRASKTAASRPTRCWASATSPSTAPTASSGNSTWPDKAQRA